MKTAKFRELYDFCQTQTPKVKSKSVIDKAVQITEQSPIRTIMDPLDITVIRGYFLSATNTEHPFVRNHGRNVTVLAKGMNPCWQRFVTTKEAMHLFDDDAELTNTEDKFEKLLIEWVMPSAEKGQQILADMKGIWMALACLCPEKNRLEFEVLLTKGQINSYDIALLLKIPELYVPLLFRPQYPAIVERLLR